MKIFSCEQIREIDDYTIRYEPVASIRPDGESCRSVVQLVCFPF